MNEITSDYTKFNSRDYLEEYYSEISPENLALLEFSVKAFQKIPQNGILLDFGGGPTIYALIAAANSAQEIHFCDYLDSNLDEIRQWLNGNHSAFSWQEFVKVVLELENEISPTPETIRQRKLLIRERVTRVFNCDLNNVPSINAPVLYDVLISNFCTENAAHDKTQWRTFFHNIVSLLRPDGFILLSVIKGATCYAVGEKLFSAVNLNEEDVIQALIEEGFNLQTMMLESIPADPSSHYQGLIFVLAQKMMR